MKAGELMAYGKELTPDAAAEAAELMNWLSRVPWHSAVGMSGGEIVAYHPENKNIYSRLKLDDQVMTWVNLVGCAVVVL